MLRHHLVASLVAVVGLLLIGGGSVDASGDDGECPGKNCNVNKGCIQSAIEACEKKPNGTCPEKPCPICPPGWTPGYNLPTQANGTANATHCYKFVSWSGSGPAAQYDFLCGEFNSTVVSIESEQENALVLNVALAAQPDTWAIILGLRLDRTSLTREWRDPQEYAAIRGVSWTDGTVVSAKGYGFATGLEDNAGIFPWASTGWRPQPDNLAPAPCDCAVMWVAAGQTCGGGCPDPLGGGTNKLTQGAWDDLPCTSNYFPATVCEYVPY